MKAIEWSALERVRRALADVGVQGPVNLMVGPEDFQRLVASAEALTEQEVVGPWFSLNGFPLSICVELERREDP